MTKLNFQHHYSSLLCHMFLQKSFLYAGVVLNKYFLLINIVPFNFCGNCEFFFRILWLIESLKSLVKLLCLYCHFDQFNGSLPNTKILMTSKFLNGSVTHNNQWKTNNFILWTFFIPDRTVMTKIKKIMLFYLQILVWLDGFSLHQRWRDLH